MFRNYYPSPYDMSRVKTFPIHMWTDLYRASPIDTKYAQMGGSRSPLGNPIGNESSIPGIKGTMRRYQHGFITWSEKTGAHAFWGPIATKWRELGGRLFLGNALSDLTTDGLIGSYGQFEYGHIYHTLMTGANEVHGSILEKYIQLGGHKGYLGYPVSDEMSTPDGKGKYNHFTFGNIYWSPNSGAHEVRGPILQEYTKLGATTSKLGFPVSGEFATDVPGGLGNNFQGGVIKWDPIRGASVQYK